MGEVNLRNAKLMGGIGAILPLVAGLFFRNSTIMSLLFSVVSIVLIFMSLSDISKKTKTPEIFSYYLIGFILSIVSYIILIIFVFVGGANVLFSILTGSLAGFRALGAGAVAILLAYYGLMVASYYYTKKSFDSASVALNNPHFKTAGLLLFLGTILLIIVIGALVLLVGVIFEIVAFFSIPDELEIGTPPPPAEIVETPKE